jgi:hypothetical protein
MQQCELSMTVLSTDYSKRLGMEIWLNTTLLFDTDHVDQPCEIRHCFDDVDAQHLLSIRLKGKTHSHTQIDTDGQITADARLCITDIKFDQVQLEQIVTDLAVYRHDHNGTTEPVEEKFYGEMGCNGTVELKFTSPVYVWLLENL